MAPLRGWGKKGKKLSGQVPYGHWQTMTFVGALRHNGIVAPCVRDVPTNGRCFVAYVKKFFVPCLSERDIVVIDNLSAPKLQRARHLIEQAGATWMFWPAHSPDLKPIE